MKSPLVALSPHQLLAVLGIVVAAPACGGSVSGAGDQPIVLDLDGSVDAASLIIHIDSGTRHDASSAVADTGVDASHESPKMIAVPLNGCTPSEYNAGLTVGTQTFQLSVDTGSTTLGVASTKCTSCGVNPEYAPGPSAVDENMTGVSQYGTGAWSGEIYEDTVGVPSNDTAPVRLVAIDTQSQFFQSVQCTGGAPQGIVGFAPSGSAVNGTNGFFDDLVAATGMPNVFATELCGTTGTLWLGGFDPSFTTAAPTYVPFSNSFFSPYYYTLNLSSITVAGTTTPVANGQYTDSLVDTGTSIVILGTAAFNGITAAIASSPGFQQVFGGADAGVAFLSSPQNCIGLGMSKAELDATLPPLTLTFGAITVQAAATESYLINYGSDWCPALDQQPEDPNNFPFAAILGSPILRSNVIIFDRANSRMGFAPHTPCP